MLRHHQLSLLSRWERQRRAEATLTVQQQEELVTLLAQLLLEAAQVSSAGDEERCDE